MPFQCISPQENWMENINLRLDRSEHMKCIRCACRKMSLISALMIWMKSCRF